MQSEENRIIPVLLGADLNCYTMARAFYEAYGAFSYAFGKMPLGATSHARFIRFTTVPSLGERRVALQVLRDFARKMRERGHLFLVPCTDEYAYFLIDCQAALKEDYLLSVPPRSFLSYFEKDVFYAAARRYAIPTPATIAFSAPPSKKEAEDALLRLGAPVVIKPADSRTYWHHPFPLMEKVYFADTAARVCEIANVIFASGYPGRLLIQKYIPGGDAAAATLTVYCDRHARVRLRAAADVLLEEHTPRGKGNYAALLSAPIPPIADPICRFLEREGYVGFANFDLRTDRNSGVTYALEMNLRQGRSSHFLCAAGENPARWLVRDLLGEDLPKKDLRKSALFRTVTHGALQRYAPDPLRLAAATRLFGTAWDSPPYRGDLFRSRSLRRALYLALHTAKEEWKLRRFAPRVR